MARLTPSQLVFIARQHFDAGRLQEAEGLCRKILAGDPQCAEALHVAGLAAEGSGALEVAAAFLRRAAMAEPTHPLIQIDLGRVCRKAGQIQEAIAAYRQALKLMPDDDDALSGLGDALHEQGLLHEAIDVYRKLTAEHPQLVDVMIRLGDALEATDQLDAASDAYRQSLVFEVSNPAIFIKLGVVLERSGSLRESLAAFQSAVRIQPASAEGHFRLGMLLRRCHRFDDAAISLQQSVTLDPIHAPACVQLGNVLLDMGRIDLAAAEYCRAMVSKPADPDVYARMGENATNEAHIDAATALSATLFAQQTESAQICCTVAGGFQRRRMVDPAITLYGRALELEPTHLVALNNLGLVLKDAGRIDDAIECCRWAVDAHPHVSACHANLLYTLHFHPASTAESLLEEHRHWADRHAQLPTLERTDLSETSTRTDSRRRLRIGYVSPDFNVHPVGRFLSALMAHHDHESFEIICYSSVRRPDALTDRFQQLADRWVHAGHLSDIALAREIRDDGVDILVDLTMHMADSRLLTFAQKPAPIQITYLAYCSTTGLETIDYRFTDPYLNPPGGDDHEYTEKSVHLPQTYWCYDEVLETPPVNPLPALSNGYVTFASLNNFCKVSPAAWSLWADLLRAVPNSRLIIHAVRGSHRARAVEQFSSAGIDSSRLKFFDLLTLPDYFKLHYEIDLALDPFPYPGGTTTCDALWMGVPTISLFGIPAFTRSGLSILSNAGLPQLAVSSEAEYLQTAISVASDLSRLAEMREALRDRMKNSPLMDGPRFARDVEAIYRELSDRGQD